jgi:hypothetical protein
LDLGGVGNNWRAVFDPDTPPQDKQINISRIGQNQITATLAALLAQIYRAAVTRLWKQG